MKKAIIFITGIDFLFIILIGISVLFTGFARDAIELLAFILPISIGFLLISRVRGEEEEAPKIGFGTKGADFLEFLPLIFPTVGLVIGISFLTSLLLTSLGYQSNPMPSEDLFTSLLMHALLPALLEEILFRYIPIRLLLGHSGRYCILISTLYFAMTHGNLFTIPYAAAAGLLFTLIDIKYKSVLPSFILHLFNNTFAILLSCGVFSQLPSFTVPLVFSLIAAASLLIIFIKRKSYLQLLTPLFDKRRDGQIHYAPFIFLCVTAAISIFNLTR